MKKKNKLWLGGLTGLTLLAPVAAVVSCGFGGGDKTDPQSFAQKDIAEQVNDEKAVEAAADKTSIEIAVRGDELDAYEGIAKLFNSYGHGKVNVKTMLDPGDMDNAYKKYDAVGAIKTLSIANADVIGQLVAGNSNYAKPLVISDFLSEKNKDLYNVFSTEKSFTTEDVQPAHLKIDSNDQGVQFGFPVGYSSTSLYANWRIIEGRDVATKIYAWVPNPDNNGTVTRIDEKGVPTDDPAKAVVLADHLTYQSIQDVILGSGFKPEKGKNIKTDSHHSTPVGNWIGYGPSNMSQRIASIGYSIARKDNGNTIPEYGGIHSFALKESLGGFPYLASSGLSKDGVAMYDTSTSTLMEKGFNKQITTNGFSDELARYFWNAFGGYMSKNAGSFINNQGLPNTGITGEVEPFKFHQTIFMQNALWAEKMANSGWHDNGKGGFKTTYAANEHMMSSGDVVKFSLPYGEVSGDSYIMPKSATPKQSLVAKRFLKFMEQSGDTKTPLKVTYTPANDKTEVTETVGEAVAHKFTSAFAPIKTLQEQKIKDGLKKPDGIGEKSSLTTRTDDASRIYLSALKQTQYGNKSKDTPSDPYNGVAGTIWTKDDNNYYTLMKAQLAIYLQYFKGQEESRTWTYEEFKNALKNASKKYFSEQSLG